MSDWEDCFGAGVDAEDVIDAINHSNWMEQREQRAARLAEHVEPDWEQIRKEDDESAARLKEFQASIDAWRSSPGWTPPTPRRKANDRNAAVEAQDADTRARFDALRAWRRDRAAEQGVPPYVIFQDKTLLEIAQREPGSLDALAAISGVCQSKIDRYGKHVLKALTGLA